MKRYLTIIAAVCAVFASCHPDDDATTSLKVSEDAISLAATDANDTFTVSESSSSNGNAQSRAAKTMPKLNSDSL